MLIPFESLPDTARVWVYQADQPLSPDQQETVKEEVSGFIRQWEAHGAPLRASFRISHDQFLIIGVDESANPVTGCSTDAHVRFVQLLQQKIGVNFFDRNLVALLVDEQVDIVPLRDLKEKRVNVGQDTLTFNNLVNTKGQLATDWMQPAGKTWLARFM